MFPPRARAFLQLSTLSLMQLDKVSQEGNRSEKQCSELRAEVADLTHKLGALKEKVSIHEQISGSASQQGKENMAQSW